MAKNEAAVWGIVGAIVGAMTVNTINPDFSILGALAGAVLSYHFGKNV
jgi:hypothetical protein